MADYSPPKSAETGSPSTNESRQVSGNYLAVMNQGPAKLAFVPTSPHNQVQRKNAVCFDTNRHTRDTRIISQVVGIEITEF